MKFQNRLTLLGLIGILLISPNLASPTHAVVDNTAPLFSSVSFDKTNATVGETVSVIVAANDPESGVAYCGATVYGSLNEWLTWVSMSYDTTTGLCTGSFVVNQFWSSFGYINYVELSNNANNYSYYYNGSDFTSPIVNFVNTTPDNSGPIFQSVSFDKTNATVGDSVIVNVLANDPESGISYCYVNIYDAQNNYLEGLWMNYDSISGLCSGSFVVQQFWPSSGHIESVELGNNAGNYTYWYDPTDFTSPVVNFINTTPDTTGPLLYSTSFESTYLYVGQELILNANVSDPESGISYCWGTLHGSTGYVDSIYLEYNATTGYCRGSVQVSEYWPASIFLNSLEVQNNANNYSYFYNGIDFNLSNVTIDYTDIFAPEIFSEFDYMYEFSGDNWIVVDSTEAGYGSVYLDAMKIADLNFNSPDAFWFNTTNYANGEHNLDIWVYDNAGNFAEYHYIINIRNSESYFDTFWYTYDDNLDGIYDNLEVESVINYSYPQWTHVEVELVIEKFDTTIGNYTFYSQFSETRDLIGDGVETIYHYFYPTEEGDYRFSINFYIDYAYDNTYSVLFYSALGISNGPFPININWELFTTEEDRDGDFNSDHILFAIPFKYDNLPPSDVEINAQVMYGGQIYSIFKDNFHLQGVGEFKSGFEFQADEDNHYSFIIDIFVNGEHRGTLEYEWDGYRFDPTRQSHTDPISKTNTTSSDEETSGTPELPLPVGDFYLFAISIFSATIVFRRKYR